MLDRAHKLKIDNSEAIVVINPDGYIGDSTRSEIEHSITTGKPRYYMEPIESDPDGHRLEELGVYQAWGQEGA